MTLPSSTNANGIWNMPEVRNAVYDGSWPSVYPGKPTNVAATQTANTTASVTFVAPAASGASAITGYRATFTISGGGSVTFTNSTSPITATGLTAGATYSVTVAATNTQGYGGESDPVSLTLVPTSQQAYTTAGTYSWTAPTGVTSVCVVAVGGGGANGVGGNGAGGGGGLGWINNYAVTPGSSYTVVVGARGTGDNGGSDSYFVSTSVVRGGGGGGSGNAGSNGGTYTGTGGGNGGAGGQGGGNGAGGGGGAGGYAGNGGSGGTSGGGYGGGGGGVGILGQGANGAGGTGGSAPGNAGNGGGGGGGPGGGGPSGFGGGGSGGQDGNQSGGTVANSGGAYGGGGGVVNGYGGVGAVRIIWGPNRAFPSTNTGNL